MAKINITLDTEAGTSSVSINDVELTDVAEICIYIPNEDYWGDYGPEKPYFKATQSKEDEATDVKTTTYVSASKDLITKDQATGLYIKAAETKKSVDALAKVFKCPNS